MPQVRRELSLSYVEHVGLGANGRWYDLGAPRYGKANAITCREAQAREMEPRSNETVVAGLTRLDHLDKGHIALAKKMFEAFGGAMYGMDLLATGALNRSRAHIAGFRQLIEAKNLICAGALLRLQLDTALRFYAAFLVEKPHDFALALLQGKKVRDLKDMNGQRMTDAYLVQKLGEEFDWVPRVYERTSGYVHLSATHVFSAIDIAAESTETDHAIAFKITAIDKPLPSSIYMEAVDGFCAATDIFLTYVHGWVFTKANPDLIQQWRRDAEAMKATE